MLEQLGLTVFRAIPAHLKPMIDAGIYTVYGGVVRDGAGHIVAHLAMPAVQTMLGSVPLVGSAISATIQSFQLHGIAQDVKRVIDMTAVNTALAGLNLATAATGFAFLAWRLDRIDKKLTDLSKDVKQIKLILQSVERAKLREAVDSLRHAAAKSTSATMRKQLLMQCKQAFGQLAHHYKTMLDHASELAEVEAAEEHYTTAALGSLIAANSLGLYDEAAEDMRRFHSGWQHVVRDKCKRLMPLAHPTYLLDGRYVDRLPIKQLVRLLDFVHAETKGVERIDELRRPAGRRAWSLLPGESVDEPTIEFTNRVCERNDVLSSYAAHFEFLARYRLSATAFSSKLDDLVQREAAPVLWIQHPAVRAAA